MRGPVNIAVLVFFGALTVAVILIVVLLRNPATHYHLEDPEHYDRTELAYLGEQYTYVGYAGEGEPAPIGDEDIAGRVLYTRLGCSGCHGTFAEGATVASGLWEVEQSDFIRQVRGGPSGMPAYGVDLLKDDDVTLLYEFIQTQPAEAEALAVTTTTRPPPTTVPPPPTTTMPTDDGDTETADTLAPAGLAVEALRAAITVDGDPAEWADIPGLELTMGPLRGRDLPSVDASIKLAHDGTSLFLLFTVEDDFNWSSADPHLSGAPGVMWPVDAAAGPHMGGEEPTGYPALGMVDIWFWRLDCAAGVASGGAVSGSGTGDPGNDEACNFDDEWSTEPFVQEDDVGPNAENSLYGVYSHTNPVEDGAGTWFFEMSRPLQTADPQDAQFAVGESSRLALAYWDPDSSPNGWGPSDHLQSSDLGWIDVHLVP